MNKRSLTYFMIFSLVLSLGPVLSHPGVTVSSTSQAESLLSGDASNLMLNFTVFQSEKTTDNSKDIDWNNCLFNEKFRGYSIKNHPLSECVFLTNKNFRRTGIWFTPQLKN